MLTEVLTDIVEVGKLRPSNVGDDNVEATEALDRLSRDLVDALVAERISGDNNVSGSSERVARLLGTLLVRAVVDRDLGSTVGEDLADGSAWSSAYCFALVQARPSVVLLEARKAQSDRGPRRAPNPRTKGGHS